MTRRISVLVVVLAGLVGCGPEANAFVVPATTATFGPENAGAVVMSLKVDFIGDGTWDPFGWVKVTPKNGSAVFLRLDPGFMQAGSGINSGSYVVSGPIGTWAVPLGDTTDLTVDATYTFCSGGLQLAEVDSATTFIHVKR